MAEQFPVHWKQSPHNICANGVQNSYIHLAVTFLGSFEIQSGSVLLINEKIMENLQGFTIIHWGFL
ncbi:MAG: hypothetical protein ACD_21C00240G0001 [uncultured bacterium]|nr:MAG: hypothetical protein ACD_21C00240G0001 [uncultured bacterium]